MSLLSESEGPKFTKKDEHWPQEAECCWFPPCKADLGYIQKGWVPGKHFRACYWTGDLLHFIHSIHSLNLIQTIHTITTKTYGQVSSLIFVFGETDILGWAQSNRESKEWLKTKPNRNTMYHNPASVEGSLPLGSGAINFVESSCEMFAQL